jgi:hypothetical protein
MLDFQDDDDINNSNYSPIKMSMCRESDFNGTTWTAAAAAAILPALTSFTQNHDDDDAADAATQQPQFKISFSSLEEQFDEPQDDDMSDLSSKSSVTSSAPDNEDMLLFVDDVDDVDDDDGGEQFWEHLQKTPVEVRKEPTDKKAQYCSTAVEQEHATFDFGITREQGPTTTTAASLDGSYCDDSFSFTSMQEEDDDNLLMLYQEQLQDRTKAPALFWQTKRGRRGPSNNGCWQ